MPNGSFTGFNIDFINSSNWQLSHGDTITLGISNDGREINLPPTYTLGDFTHGCAISPTSSSNTITSKGILDQVVSSSTWQYQGQTQTMEIRIERNYAPPETTLEIVIGEDTSTPGSNFIHVCWHGQLDGFPDGTTGPSNSNPPTSRIWSTGADVLLSSGLVFQRYDFPSSLYYGNNVVNFVGNSNWFLTQGAYR